MADASEVEIAQIQALGQVVVSARYAVVIGISMSVTDICTYDLR